MNKHLKMPLMILSFVLISFFQNIVSMEQASPEIHLAKASYGFYKIKKHRGRKSVWDFSDALNTTKAKNKLEFQFWNAGKQITGNVKFESDNKILKINFTDYFKSLLAHHKDTIEKQKQYNEMLVKKIDEQRKDFAAKAIDCKQVIESVDHVSENVEALQRHLAEKSSDVAEKNACIAMLEAKIVLAQEQCAEFESALKESEVERSDNLVCMAKNRARLNELQKKLAEKETELKLEQKVASGHIEQEVIRARGFLQLNNELHAKLDEKQSAINALEFQLAEKELELKNLRIQIMELENTKNSLPRLEVLENIETILENKTKEKEGIESELSKLKENLDESKRDAPSLESRNKKSFFQKHSPKIMYGISALGFIGLGAGINHYWSYAAILLASLRR